jgi:cell division protein FtsQ
MFWNRKVKALLFAVLCLSGFLFLAAFSKSRQQDKICKKVNIKIDNEYNNYFLSETEVLALLTRNGDQPLEGMKKGEIDLKRLELRIKSHKFVREAEVYHDLDGNINVLVKQNRPIARLLSAERDVYLDEEGNVLPLSSLYTAHVIPVTSSAVKPTLANSFFQDSVGRPYLELLRFIEQDPFWDAQLAHMDIDAKGKVSFLTQVGDQRIEFGKPHHLEEKFRKLFIFYKEVLPVVGWEKYSRLNVEYKDQIICE